MNKVQNSNTVENTVDNQTSNIASKEAKKSKNESQKDFQIIFKFLLDCTQYEADALRVMVQLSRKGEPQINLSKDDTLAVNRFLNFGLSKNNPTLDDVRNHRHSRADILMNSVARFVGKEEIMKIITFLYGFAINAKDVEDVFKLKQAIEPTVNSHAPSLDKSNTESGK